MCSTKDWLRKFRVGKRVGGYSHIFVQQPTARGDLEPASVRVRITTGEQYGVVQDIWIASDRHPIEVTLWVEESLYLSPDLQVDVHPLTRGVELNNLEIHPFPSAAVSDSEAEPDCDDSLEIDWFEWEDV